MNSQFKSTVKRAVYFDTNVYTHIYHAIKGSKLERSYGLTSMDVRQLIRLLKSDQLRILASYVNFEETLSAILSDEKEAFNRLKLIRKIAKRKRIIKYHTEILQDDIKAFALGERPKSPFASPLPALRILCSESSKNDPLELKRIVLETQEQIKENRKNQNRDLLEIKELIAKGAIQTDGSESPTFQEFWAWRAEAIAETMAGFCGVLDTCKERGIDKLLKVRSVRAATYVHAVQTYKNVFNKQSSIGKGDGRDAQHFFLSSATGCFVSHDENLVRLLSKMDFPEIQVMTLKSLLNKFNDR